MIERPDLFADADLLNGSKAMFGGNQSTRGEAELLVVAAIVSGSNVLSVIDDVLAIEVGLAGIELRY